MATDAPWQWGVARIARAVAAGELSAEDVLRSFLDRVDAVNPILNAIVDDRREEAIAVARASDARRAQGEPGGPLDGVPVTTKTNVAQRGCATSNGVVAFRDAIATEDAPVVANLRRADAILFGRTNVPAFSWRWFTSNALHGATLNPHDSAITCGGSSGGAAVAVATGMCAVAHGSDLAGSIRHPAACCGVFGFKPSLGAIPNYDPGAPERPLLSQLMVTQGPIARSVEDLRLGLHGMRGADPRDPWFIDAEPRARTPQGRIALLAAPASGVDQEVVDSLALAATQFEAAGFSVETLEIPLWEELYFFYMVLLAEGKGGLFQRIDDLGDPLVRNAAAALRPLADRIDPAGYAAALAGRGALLRRWRALTEPFDAVLAPVCWRMPFANDADQPGGIPMPEIIRTMLPTVTANLLGLPALAFPGPTQSLPIGLQLIGRHFADDSLFDIADHVARDVAVMDPQRTIVERV
ncbi:amidase [Sphingopyxis sp. J-6]|uniref:amidase n=1 Tax=Sphingopyxis sp. J-6 TaxID=3122054 RepID=UPI003983FDAA